MANTTLAAASVVQKWDAQYFAEYVRSSGFKPYMGRGSNSIINTKYQLASGGQVINIPLVTRLSGAGVTGSSTLEGNEEALGNYSHAVTIGWLRNAVRLTKDQEHYTEMDLRRASKDMLQSWSMEKLRDAIIAAMQSVGGVAYGSATEAQKDAWIDNNVDRVLFGAAKSNLSTTAPAGGATYDHSGSLAAVDTTNDTLTAGRVSLMKRIAKTADPHIRPMRVSDGREYYVLFAGSMPFRDLKNDATMAQANREARERGVDSNPIFQDGDLIYDGVIIREIPEIPVLSGVGASSADVGPVFLCGAQALAVAWGQEPRSTTDTFDYGFARGVGIEEARGVNKLVYNDKDHGIVTGFFAAAADA
jgi:N4-gp56 family major capsid protein